MDYNYEKERQEAIDAGNRALFSLRAAQGQLNSAKNWGVVDLLGGGLITSIIKRSKMETRSVIWKRLSGICRRSAMS